MPFPDLRSQPRTALRVRHGQSAARASQEGTAELRLQGFRLQPYHCLSDEEAERIRQALPEAWQQGHYERVASQGPLLWYPTAPPDASAAQ
ncbi:MAG TPA: hypothetical protein G4O04_00575 [Anaerolineae bacterium]|nr:hypothetical protein [Anaerolineae bacterium]HID85234.1 hypothetical protein [Anaerolineales bacterium]HIQ09076.1 hypothetical protein [Anaerolineaceae bacterium]